MADTTEPTAAHEHQGHSAGPAPWLQWIGLFLAPAAFFAHLQVAYLLVLRDCGRDGGLFLVQLAGFLGTALAAAGLWAAWMAWVRSGREQPGDAGGALPRTRLVAILGLGLSAVLVLILAAQWIAGFVVPRCQ